MKTLSISDLPIPKSKEELIGRVYPCPFPGCETSLDIGSAGIDHIGYRHMLRYSLEDLFVLATVHYPHWREMENELFYGKKKI